MQYKHIQVGKYNIHILDDVFTLSEREWFYMFFSKSMFKLGWEDSIELHEKHKQYLYSEYASQDVNNSKFFTTLHGKQYAEINHIFQDKKPTLSVVNLSTPAYSYLAHSHSEKLSLLYYANLRWQENWAGETMFFSEDLKDVVFTSPYTPGRIVIFDNPLPHSIRAQSMEGPQYRFTFASFLEPV